MVYQDWLFKDHPSGWCLRYRRNGGGYEASRDGERWIPVPSVTQVTGLLNKNLQEWAVRQVVEYLKGELQPGLVLSPEEVERILQEAATAHHRAAQGAAGRGGASTAGRRPTCGARIRPSPRRNPCGACA